MMFVLISVLAIAHCTELQSAGSGDQEYNSVEPSVQQPTAAVNESVTAGGLREETATAGRSKRQFYPVAYGYVQASPYADRRAYKVTGTGQPNNSVYRRPLRMKSGRRPVPKRPRPVAGVTTQARYRRLPPMQRMRPQHVNYADPGTGAAVDYYDDGGAGLESAPQPVPFDFGPERQFDREQAAGYAMYGPNGPARPIGPLAAVQQSTTGTSRKRPAAPVTGYGHDADVPLQAVVHVPVRVARPAVPTPAAAALVAAAQNTVPAADLHLMEDKLRRLVLEAMEEHFAARHQELYADGFDKLQHPVYSSKYKNRGAGGQSADKDKGSAVKSTAVVATPPPAKDKDTTWHQSSADAESDGSDDRLTLAEISAYMGAKPAETVLSAGGHRYVLSDALQQSYRLQKQQQQQQQQQQLQERMYDGVEDDDRLYRPQQQQQQRMYDGEDDGHHHEPTYLRYVSPFEALYELPAARWAYR